MKYEQHGKSYTRLYRIWESMKKRCYNPNVACYKSYGGRGIKVCHRWRYSFSEFEKWALSHGYADNLTIDRIDNNKGYMPTNCRWITREENSSKDCVFKLNDVPPEVAEYRRKYRVYTRKLRMYNELLEDGVDLSKVKKPMPPEKPAI